MFDGTDQNAIGQKIFKACHVGVRCKVQDVYRDAGRVERGELFNELGDLDRCRENAGFVIFANWRLSCGCVVVQGYR